MYNTNKYCILPSGLPSKDKEVDVVIYNPPHRHCNASMTLFLVWVNLIFVRRETHKRKVTPSKKKDPTVVKQLHGLRKLETSISIRNHTYDFPQSNHLFDFWPLQLWTFQCRPTPNSMNHFFSNNTNDSGSWRRAKSYWSLAPHCMVHLHP